MHSPTSQPPRQDVDDRPLPVLVVGAGPAGLTLACSLRRADVAVRLIDKATEPPADRSRAMVLQPRTLELFDDLGIVDEALGAGLLIEDVNFYSPGGGVGTVHFGSRRLDSPYANLLGLPQDQTERILGERLTGLGGAIEHGVELTAYTETPTGVDATVRHADGGTESIHASWIVGCDGARSTVRQLAGLPFEGLTYPDDGLIGDVALDWAMPHDRLSVCPQGDGFLLAFPLPGDGHFRVIMIAPSLAPPDDRSLSRDEFERVLAQMTPHGMGVGDGPPVIREVYWLTRYRLHRRGVPSYRRGRAFVAGDAAHVHSPVGAQGMNTAIQDSYNLGWKLALVVKGRAPDAPLVDVTRGATRLFDCFRGPHHTLLSSGGSAAHVDQAWLASIAARDADVFRVAHISASTATDDWPLLDASGEAHRKYGAEHGALYLIRPDGHVAFRGTLDDAGALDAGLTRRFIGRPDGATGLESLPGHG